MNGRVATLRRSLRSHCRTLDRSHDPTCRLDRLTSHRASRTFNAEQPTVILYGPHFARAAFEFSPPDVDLHPLASDLPREPSTCIRWSIVSRRVSTNARSASMSSRSATIGVLSSYSIPYFPSSRARAPPLGVRRARDPIPTGHAGVRIHMKNSRHERSVLPPATAASLAGRDVPRLVEPSARPTSTAPLGASRSARESGAGARQRRAGARAVAPSTLDTAPTARPATTVQPPVSRRVRDVHAAACPSPLRPRSVRRCSPRASSAARLPRVPHVPGNRCRVLPPRRSPPPRLGQPRVRMIARPAEPTLTPTERRSEQRAVNRPVL